MKRTILLLITILALQSGIYAQPGPKAKIKEAKIEYLKNKLRLTPEEEKAFIPLYGQYMEELEKLRKEFKQDVDLVDIDITFMDDKECEKVNNDILAFREKELALFRKYHEEYKKVLPVKKITMLYKSELDFKKELIKELRKRRKEEKKPGE